MVLPNGDLLAVDESTEADLMQKVRCSYGLFGVIYEVTYKVRPLLPMAVHHRTFSLRISSALCQISRLETSR
jgi:FAD/FMN-containing dehydrogenase